MSRRSWSYMMVQHIATLENIKKDHQKEIRRREIQIVKLQKEIEANYKELETVK